ncbi:zf-HC2 domain-containing protein [Paenibacillus sp. YPG26]|uniref:zf-HC2 domain-containing protein n=1 Tax=Paenibacillus sp. YPG26 TaxID=2878915 RepID=UPI00203C890F|nr:zf-HC2 domain-containing protein [Paenibacillus sp. YPG26]USB34419.1 zf-HC2 domain-containing protein [Paenibacillus sp. YPG26]
MKCPEAVEWMHRYLDGDLNAEESDLLIKHLRSCDDCAEAFGLLKHLSDNLYQLPDVTPKFSIVDSILPRLEEMDRARAEEGSTLEMTEPAVPLMRTVPNKVTQPKRSSFWQRSSRTWIGGVAAAAVILGLFIYQYEPVTVPNAEIASTGTSYQMQQSITEDSEVTGSVPSDMINSSKIQDQAKKVNPEAAPQEDGKQGNVETDPLTGLQTDAIDRNSAQTDGAAVSPKKEGSGDQSSVTPKEPRQSMKKETAPAQETAPADERNSSSGNDLPTSEKATPKKPSDSQREQENQIAKEPDDKASSTGPVTNTDNSMMGITSFKPIKVSPDGKYTVEVEQGHLKVYANDGQSRTLLTDTALNGDWVKGEWSEDSKVFHYQTIKDDMTKDFSFNVADSNKSNSTNSSQ